MNIEAIQTSIVTQLQAAFSLNSLAFEALDLPDNDADYKKAVQRPIAFVVYTGSTSPGVKNTNPVVQDRKLQFSVEVFSRLLYGEAGIFIVRHFVEKALVGFVPLSCNRMYLVKDEINRGEDSIWFHAFSFECMTMLVQDQLSDPVVVQNFQTLKAKFENALNSGDAGNGAETTLIPENT